MLLRLAVQSEGPRDAGARALYRGILQLLKRQGFTVATRNGPGPGQCRHDDVHRKLPDLARDAILTLEFQESSEPERLPRRRNRS